MADPRDDFSNLEGPARAVAEASRRPRSLVYLTLGLSVVLSWLVLLSMSRRAAEIQRGGPGSNLLEALPSLELPGFLETFFVLCLSPSAPGGAAGEFFALLAMWVLMSVAMMLPSAAPMIRTYCEIADTATAKGEAAVSPLLLVAGYLTVWSGVALIFATVTAILRALGHDLGAPLGSVAAAVILGLAGLYQFSGLKDACLEKCRNPFTILFARWSVRPIRIFVLGMEQGVWCVGCCWALMLVMFAVGTMNLFWMVLIGIFSLVEKQEAGRVFTRLAGGILLVWAAALLVASLS